MFIVPKLNKTQAAEQRHLPVGSWVALKRTRVPPHIPTGSTATARRWPILIGLRWVQTSAPASNSSRRPRPKTHRQTQNLRRPPNRGPRRIIQKKIREHMFGKYTREQSEAAKLAAP